MTDILDAYKTRLPPMQRAALEGFVVAAVRDMGTEETLKTRALLSVAMRHAQWCYFNGYPLDREVVFRRDIIALSVAHGLKDAKISTQATYRSRLFEMSATLVSGPHRHIKVPSLAKRDAAAPYTPAEVAQIESWAAYQPTQYRRISATMMVALCMGAGLNTRELCGVRANHIHTDPEGVLVQVTEGPAPRSVPVLQKWESVLTTMGASSLRGDQFVFLPRRITDYHSNMTSTFVNSGAVPFSITASRLRTTWIVQQLTAGTPPKVLKAAAGMAERSQLDGYWPHVPDALPADARRMLTKAATLKAKRDALLRGDKDDE